MLLGSLGRQLVDLGCHFGAHWILKGVPKVILSWENQHKMRKVRVQDVVKKKKKIS